MRARTLAPIILLVLAAFSADVSAQNVSATVRIGTRGVGVGVATKLAPTLNARALGNYFTVSTDGEDVLDGTDVAWDAEGDLLFASAYADWHPFQNLLRITGGLVYNGMNMNGGIVPLESIEVGRNSFTPEEVGDLHAEVTFKNKIAPYIGMGLGDAAKGKFGFLFDVGAMYTGSPNVDLKATGMLTPTESEGAQIEENLSWAQWYPVVSFGIHIGLTR